MLLVHTTIKPSPIHGIGLFAAERIEKGTIVWSYEDLLDQRIKRDEIPVEAINTINHYGYVNEENPDHVVLCFDDARFMNFGIPCNTEMSEPTICGEKSLRATRDIEIGEEITVPLNSDADAPFKLNLVKEEDENE